MGEIVGIRIKNFEYISCKNTFGDLLLLFSEDDLKVEDVLDDDGEYYKKYCFYTTVSKAKMCLDCLGYTLKEIKTIFERNKASKLENIRYCQEMGFDDIPYSYEDIENNFIFEQWLKAVKKYASILSNDFYDYSSGNYMKLEDERTKKLSITERIVLDSLPWSEKFFGFNKDDTSIWNVFRVILEAFDPNENVFLDYTNLYNGGWCNEFPEEEDYSVEKTIILTEGKFDANVISQSMKLLYPYMSKFYSFINFSEYKVQGSTNFLTHYLKVFIASGINNRVIAIYDNDSAGKSELIDLNSITLPDNYRIMHLPDIKIAEKYPTLGPNGLELMSINGKACSIELFLGKDILMNEGEFIPVQWKGYIEKTKTYQGEVMQKSLIQERFKRKLKKAFDDNLIIDENWHEMNELLNCIFNAFQ